MRAQDGERIPILRVEVWYADGSRSSAVSSAKWRRLPDGVVLAIVLYDLVRRGKYLQDVLAGHEWYWWHGGRVDNTRAGDIPRDCAPSAIKKGAQVPDEVFTCLYNEACEGVSAAG
jgi:hypothetical protein